MRVSNDRLSAIQLPLSGNWFLEIPWRTHPVGISAEVSCVSQPDNEAVL